MSTHTVPIDHSLKPEHALLADQIGNEIYASHYSERKAYRFILGCGTSLLCGSMWLNFSLAHRPIANRYIRIDEMGRAQAIQYTDLNYSPREGEVRTYLTDWANYRYTINRETIAKKYTPAHGRHERSHAKRIGAKVVHQLRRAYAVLAQQLVQLRHQHLRLSGFRRLRKKQAVLRAIRRRGLRT